MAYRYHPKYSETDIDNPRAWGTCDRCGFIWNLHRLTWQWDYRGSPNLINTRILVCEKCYDTPQPQLSPVILEPDPPPLYNARPEAYAIDETSWMATEPTFDGPLPQASTQNQIAEESGPNIVTQNNPDDQADAADLTTNIPGNQNNP